MKPRPEPITRYELPPGQISLLGYVVRRMHKTERLAAVSRWLGADQPEEALAELALYAADASASFGPAFYRPRFNRVGETVSEADPATGARVTARLEAETPHLRISYTVDMLDGSQFSGEERITGTTVSLRGLGMPAPARFSFVSADGTYTAQVIGLITSELRPGWLGDARIRAHGTLELRDNAGQTGTLRLSRDGEAQVTVAARNRTVSLRRQCLAARPGQRAPLTAPRLTTE
jgi:hypothetical protein